MNVFCYWCRIDRLTCWPAFQRTTTVPQMPSNFIQLSKGITDNCKWCTRHCMVQGNNTSSFISIILNAVIYMAAAATTTTTADGTILQQQGLKWHNPRSLSPIETFIDNVRQFCFRVEHYQRKRDNSHTLTIQTPFHTLPYSKQTSFTQQLQLHTISYTTESHIPH